MNLPRNPFLDEYVFKVSKVGEDLYMVDCPELYECPGHIGKESLGKLNTLLEGQMADVVNSFLIATGARLMAVPKITVVYNL